MNCKDSLTEAADVYIKANTQSFDEINTIARKSNEFTVFNLSDDSASDSNSNVAAKDKTDESSDKVNQSPCHLVTSGFALRKFGETLPLNQ